MLSEGNAILSCADGIAKAMEIYLRERKSPDLFNEVEVNHPSPAAHSHNEMKFSDKNKMREITGACPECPECGSMLEFKEGCASCSDISCGYSKCW
jgi:ribonucleoside-diphosphate reductase alpha chain